MREWSDRERTLPVSRLLKIGAVGAIESGGGDYRRSRRIRRPVPLSPNTSLDPWEDGRPNWTEVPQSVLGYVDLALPWTVRIG